MRSTGGEPRWPRAGGTPGAKPQLCPLAMGSALPTRLAAGTGAGLRTSSGEEADAAGSDGRLDAGWSILTGCSEVGLRKRGTSAEQSRDSGVPSW